MNRLRGDVAIVGAGVIGCSIARELALRGLRVIVLERDAPGRQATWAAAGMLSPLDEAGAVGPFLEIADHSLDQFAALADALRSDTGIDVEYRTSGKLCVSLGDVDVDLEQLATAGVARRFDARLIEPSHARELEPLLSDAVTRALLIGRDHRINNRLLVQALLASATAAGANFRSARPVASIISRDDAVAGVRLESGEVVDAAHIVLAAGAWTGRIEGVPRRIPVRPVRGQMFAVDGRRAPPLERVVLARDCYLIPRDDGRLLVGATVEDVGFQTGPTPRGLSELMLSACAVIPSIADLPVVETWAGFRPATPDGLPVIGEDPGVSGLFYATGHFRNGILLAPVTALCIAELVMGGNPPVALEPFSITRFRDT